MTIDTQPPAPPAEALEELFDLDLRVVPGGEHTGGLAASGVYTSCHPYTCQYSCTFTCTGATGRPCAC